MLEVWLEWHIEVKQVLWWSWPWTQGHGPKTKPKQKNPTKTPYYLGANPGDGLEQIIHILFITQNPQPSTWIWPCVLSRFSCVQLCNPMDCSLAGSSVHGVLQARILEWVAVSSFRGSSQVSNLHPLYLLYWLAGSSLLGATWEARIWPWLNLKATEQTTLSLTD